MSKYSYETKTIRLKIYNIINDSYELLINNIVWVNTAEPYSTKNPYNIANLYYMCNIDSSFNEFTQFLINNIIMYCNDTCNNSRIIKNSKNGNIQHEYNLYGVKVLLEYGLKK